MYFFFLEVMELFEKIYDVWELDICEKYFYDVFIGGRIICYLILRCSFYFWMYMIERNFFFFLEVFLCLLFNKFYKY